MDILLKGLISGLLTESECDQFIADIKLKGSKLPCNRIAEYKKLIAKQST